MRLCVLSSPSSILSTFSLAVTRESWTRFFCKTSSQMSQRIASKRSQPSPLCFWMKLRNWLSNLLSRSILHSHREYHECELTVDFIDWVLFRVLFPPLLLIWLRSLSLIVFFLLWSNSSSSKAIVDCKKSFLLVFKVPRFYSEILLRERKLTGGFCSMTNFFSGFFTGATAAFTGAERWRKNSGYIGYLVVFTMLAA